MNYANIPVRFWGVFWIDASDSSAIQRSYLNAAQRCQTDRRSEINDFKTAKGFFDNVKHPYLFILDNADSVNETLHPYLPTGPRATVLITSRDYRKLQYGTVGTKALEKLDMEDAIELLFKASNTPKIYRAEKRHEAEIIVQLLAQHALAVVQAGAYIYQRPCTLKEYEEEFRHQKKRRSLLRFRNTEDVSRYGDVYATFEVSAKFLEESKSTNPAYANALELLGVLGHLYFIGVPNALFIRAIRYAQVTLQNPIQVNSIEYLSPWHVSRLPKSLQGLPSNDRFYDLPDSVHEALGVLRSFAIITIQPETKDMSMHPLAHSWARDRLDDAAKRDAWASTMSLMALSLGSAYEYEDFWRNLQPHVSFALMLHLMSPLIITQQLRLAGYSISLHGYSTR